MKKIELKEKKISLHKETVALLNKSQAIKEQDKRWSMRSVCNWCGTTAN
jgi:hypothetical protein